MTKYVYSLLVFYLFFKPRQNSCRGLMGAAASMNNYNSISWKLNSSAMLMSYVEDLLSFMSGLFYKLSYILMGLFF